MGSEKTPLKKAKIELEEVLKECREKKWEWYDWAWWWIRYGIWDKITDLKWRVPNFIHRSWFGWGKADTWDLYGYLSKVNYQSLEHLKKGLHGYPTKYNSQEEWNKDLEKMTQAFKLASDIADGNREFYIPDMDEAWIKENHCLTKEEDASIKEGMQLFIDNYFCLWD